MTRPTPDPSPALRPAGESPCSDAPRVVAPGAAAPLPADRPCLPCTPSPAFQAALPGILRRRTRTAEYRTSLREWQSTFLRQMGEPDLRFVIWIATRRCNLRCRYCVLPREGAGGKDLSTAEVKRAFEGIADGFDARRIMVGITGGEATVRPDLVEIVAHLVRLGFRTVAVDSNGVNYGRRPELFDRLVDAGMRCPTISVDGVGEAQRVMRGDRSAGAWTWKAIEHAQTKWPSLGLTTICAASPLNLPEVPAVFDRFEDLGVRFARLSAIFPVGRAAADPQGEVLSAADLRRVLAWVAEQRTMFAAGRRRLEIEFVDDGWCGMEWEGGLLRASFLYCRAGLTVLGIEHDGRIVGCPVIPASYNVQGNVRTDRVADVWRGGFRAFRDRGWLRVGPCAACREWAACQGGSMHDHGDDGGLMRCTAALLREGAGADPASEGGP